MEKITLKGTKEQLQYLVVQNLALHQVMASKDIGEFYGQPVESYDESTTYKPFLRLYFEQDEKDIVGAKQKATAELSFTLMNKTSKNINKGDLDTLARKIKEVFGTSSKFLWKKGKKYCTYEDKENGYNLQIMALSVAEAKDVAQAIVSIQGHTYAVKNLTLHENQDEAAKYPDTPASVSILGDTYKEPHRRPRVDVRFAYATCHIWLKKKPVFLVDTIYKSSQSILR